VITSGGSIRRSDLEAGREKSLNEIDADLRSDGHAIHSSGGDKGGLLDGVPFVNIIVA